MSSTNRGYERHISDYYVTPKQPVRDFLKAFNKDLNNLKVLDPSCGGSTEDEATYVQVIQELYPQCRIDSIDIREDSKADIVGNFLEQELDKKYDVIITNPPFYLAKEFVLKALDNVVSGGYVVMLLRLNFFGSKDRKPFFDAHIPLETFVHHKRISFLPRDVEHGGKVYKKGSTDSIEYCHIVWQKGYEGEFTKLFVI